MRCSTISWARTQSGGAQGADPAPYRPDPSLYRGGGPSTHQPRRAQRRSRLVFREGSLGALEIPPTVQGVIASRIDRLPKEDKALLQLASVAGPRISPPLLAAVTGMTRRNCKAGFGRSKSWTSSSRRDGLPPRNRICPRSHPRGGLSLILRPQREELHRRILAAMEESSAGREEEFPEALCHHAVKAQNWVKADRYGLSRQKRHSPSAFREATEYFRIAMDAVDKRRPHSRVNSARSICASRRGWHSLRWKIEQWLGLCRDARDALRANRGQTRQLASIAIRAAALNFYGTPFEAITAGERAVAWRSNWPTTGGWVSPSMVSVRLILYPGDIGMRNRMSKAIARLAISGKCPSRHDGVEPPGALSHDEIRRVRVDRRIRRFRPVLAAGERSRRQAAAGLTTLSRRITAVASCG